MYFFQIFCMFSILWTPKTAQNRQKNDPTWALHGIEAKPKHDYIGHSRVELMFWKFFFRFCFNLEMFENCFFCPKQAENGQNRGEKWCWGFDRKLGPGVEIPGKPTPSFSYIRLCTDLISVIGPFWWLVSLGELFLRQQDFICPPPLGQVNFRVPQKILGYGWNNFRARSLA